MELFQLILNKSIGIRDDQHSTAEFRYYAENSSCYNEPVSNYDRWANLLGNNCFTGIGFSTVGFGSYEKHHFELPSTVEFALPWLSLPISTKPHFLISDIWFPGVTRSRSLSPKTVDHLHS